MRSMKNERGVAGVLHPHVLLALVLIALLVVVFLLFFFIIVPVAVMLLGAYIIYVGKGALPTLLLGVILVLAGLLFLVVVFTAGHLML